MDKPGGDRKGRGKAWRETWSHASLGIEIAGCVAVGALSGYWLDGRFGTAPWLLLVGFVAGVTAAGMAVWRVIKREERDADPGQRGQDEDGQTR